MTRRVIIFGKVLMLMGAFGPNVALSDDPGGVSLQLIAIRPGAAIPPLPLLSPPSQPSPNATPNPIAGIGYAEPYIEHPIAGDGEPNDSQRGVLIYCHKDGALVQCTGTLRIFAEANSGGHLAINHAAVVRPPGLLIPGSAPGTAPVTITSTGCVSPPITTCQNGEATLSFDTGPAAVGSFNYIAPEQGGRVLLDFYFNTSVGSGHTVFYMDVLVAQAPLVRAEGISYAGGSLIVRRNTMYHDFFDGYGTASCVARLNSMLRNYIEIWATRLNQPTPAPTIIVTGMSLPRGGLNDVPTLITPGGRWLPPHNQHRRGHNVDILTPVSYHASGASGAMAAAALLAGFQLNVTNESPANPGVDHYHLQSLD